MNIEEKIDITHLSNFKTPAKAKYFLELKKESDLQKLEEVFHWIQKEKIPYHIIAHGTNQLFAFDEYPGIIIKNSLSGFYYDAEEKKLQSFSSENISDISEEIETKYNNPLWHRFIGLPGSIGGAVYGNAGCFWLEIEHNFASCMCIDLETGKQITLQKNDMDFSYRSSRLKKEKKYFCISAEFDLSVKKEKYSSDVDNVYFRKHKQPKGNSCGSFFKNPSKEFSAGMLIEKIELKWQKIGGAFFSDLHANFLMSDGTASWQDLLELKNLAQKKVYDLYGIQLEPEVQIISLP